MLPIDEFNDRCNDTRRREQHISLGRCKECGRAPRAVNSDGLCMGCEFSGDMLKAFPKTEVIHYEDGVTVLDLSRVDLWGPRQ